MSQTISITTMYFEETNKHLTMITRSVQSVCGKVIRCLETELDSYQSQKQLVRHELDLRRQSLLVDNKEFRRVKAELRATGFCTGFGALQVLNQQVTRNVRSKSISERNLRESEKIS
jgi:hypothetical protein